MKFDGFNQAEVQEAEARLQSLLQLQDIGDDDADGQVSSEESDTDSFLGSGGNAQSNNGWHDDFIYHERGLPIQYF